jgi:phosphoribosyl-ATP pyrophosphohydrolase
MSSEKQQSKMPKTTHEKYDFLRQFITFHKYNKNKSDMAVWCPFCNNPNQHKLKMILNLEKGVYHCWVCNSKGTSIPWVIKRLSSQHYDKSLEYFPNRNQTLSDNEWTAILQGLSDEATFSQPIIQVDLPNGFELCVSNLNSRNPDVRDVVNYLTKRGCSEHKMWMLRFGVSRDSNFHRMLIIPSFNADGDLNYYTCRKIDAGTTDGTKYKNCEVSKKSIIFNELLIDWKQPLTLVEGPLDLLKTNDNATCLLGSSLAKDSALFKKIVENKTPVILALDEDAYQKAVRIAQDLMYYDIEVKMMDTSAAKDVGDMSVEMFQEYYNLACKIEADDLLLSKIQVI